MGLLQKGETNSEASASVLDATPVPAPVETVASTEAAAPTKPRAAKKPKADEVEVRWLKAARFTQVNPYTGERFVTSRGTKVVGELDSWTQVQLAAGVLEETVP